MSPSEIRFADLVDTVERAAAEAPRVLVGLCGPPGVGKSTVARRLAAALGPRAVALGMDGFHLADRILDQLGLADEKGAPETFDVDGFIALLRRVRSPTTEPVYAPVFDRSLEAAIAGRLAIRSDHDIIVVEGNYLLLDGPWAPVRSLLDLKVHLRLDHEVRRHRLISRHIRHGRTPAAAAEWVDRSDEANARLIAGTATRADRILRLDED